jgi:hypothetical protein
MIEKRSSPARDERGIHLVFKLTSAVPNETEQNRAHVYPAPKDFGAALFAILGTVRRNPFSTSNARRVLLMLRR